MSRSSSDSDTSSSSTSQTQETLLPIESPELAEPYRRQNKIKYSLLGNNGGDQEFENYNVFDHIAGLPRLYSIERWADNIHYKYGRYAAKIFVEVVNKLIDQALPIFILIFGAFVLGHVFKPWGVEQNIAEGGTGEGPNVFVYSTHDTFLVEAAGMFVFLVAAYICNKIRGLKLPNFKPFLHYIEHLKGDDKLEGLVVESEGALKKMQVYTDPKRDSKDEVEACVGFHVGFITYIANGGGATLNKQKDKDSYWEGVANALRNLSGHFTFNFFDPVIIKDTELDKPEKPLNSKMEEDVETATQPQKPNTAKLRAYKIARAHSRSLSGKDVSNAKFHIKNWAILATLTSKNASTSQTTTTVPSPSKQEEEAKPTHHQIIKDIYDTPLLSHPQESEQTSSFEPIEIDSFKTASEEEQRLAAKLNWREMQTIPYPDRTSPRDIAMRVTSFVVKLLNKRSSDLSRRAVRLHHLIKAILNDPFEAEHPSGDFKDGLAHKSFQLENLLRPAIHDAQWYNWRYFFASDDTVTSVFKRLLPEEQAQMVFILMVGNDHGKLLVLSILQDLDTSHLATFFKAYLNEFGNMPEEKAKLIYKKWSGEDAPHSIAIQDFCENIHILMRLHLLWLTENSMGHITALFEKDAGIAAKILMCLTVELPDDSCIPDIYIEHSVQPSDSSQEKIQDYYVNALEHDGSYGFSVLGVARQKVAEVLLDRIDQLTIEDANYSDKNKISLCDFLADEIRDLLLSPERRPTVPKALEQGVVLADLYRENSSNENKERLQQYGKDPKTVAAYLKYGIGFNQPLGPRTAAMYVIAEGNQQVEIFTKDSNDNSNPSQCAFKKTLPDSPVFRLVIGESSYHWAVLSDTPSEKPQPSLPLKNNARSTGIFNPRIETQRPIEHPMPLRAQKLFWSLAGNTDQQKKIIQLMKVGHPGIPVKGYPGSTEALLELSSLKNIDVIKKSVLQSGSLEALLLLLDESDEVDKDDAKNPKDYQLLAALLSDPVHGIDYQRIFQKLVHEHYVFLTKKKQISGFLNWLSGFTLEKTAIIRARYTAVMVSAVGTKEEVGADIRTSRVIEILKLAYPSQDLLTAFHNLHRAFEAIEEQEQTIKQQRVRGRITRAVLRQQLICSVPAEIDDTLTKTNDNDALVEIDDALIETNDNTDVPVKIDDTLTKTNNDTERSDFSFLDFNDKKKDLFDIILKGFEGDILSSSLAVRQNVWSWADLVGTIIAEGYSLGREKYFNNAIDRFCTILEGKDCGEHLRENLALTLLHALHSTRFRDKRSHVGYLMMCKIYDAFFTGIAAEKKQNLINSEFGAGFVMTLSDDDPFCPEFDNLNCRLKALGISDHIKLASKNDEDLKDQMKSMGILDYNKVSKKTVRIPVPFQRYCLKIVLYLLTSPAKSDKARAYHLLNYVVRHIEGYKDIIDLDRMPVFENLQLVVNNDRYKRPVTTNDFQGYQGMVHETLFMLFNFDDIKVINILKYATTFLSVCEDLGDGNVAEGLTTIIQGIKKDPIITTQSTEVINVAIKRMIILTLYAIYLPLSTTRRYQFGSGNLDKQIIIGQLVDVLTVYDTEINLTTFASNFRNEDEVTALFSAEGDLMTTFKEMQIELFGNRIYKTLKKGIKDLPLSLEDVVDEDEESGQKEELKNSKSYFATTPLLG